MTGVQTCALPISGAGSAIAFTVQSGSFYRKAIPANVVSAAIDSVAFPMIAFGSLMLGVSFAQFAAKVIGSLIIIHIMRMLKI